MDVFAIFIKRRLALLFEISLPIFSFLSSQFEVLRFGFFFWFSHPLLSCFYRAPRMSFYFDATIVL